MKKLLSLPPNLVGCFHEITGYSTNEWFCTNDPVGRKLGSGGGSAWLLNACYEAEGNGRSFDEWLAADKRLLLHAGGRVADCRPMPPRAKYSLPSPSFAGSEANGSRKTCCPYRFPSISASWNRHPTPCVP